MSYKIPKYSENRALDIGQKNLETLRKESGQIKFTGCYIHLAPICNFKCEGCFTHVKSSKKISLDFRTIINVIDFAKSRGARSIIFAGAGEPTLDPDFQRIVKYIKKQKLQIVLFTNLTTLKNIKQAEKFLINGPVIGKLYTLDKLKYNKITNYQKAFEFAMRGLGFLLEAKKKLEKEGKKPILAIDSYITKNNYLDLPNVLRFCRENKIIPYFEAFIELGQTKKDITKFALSEKSLAQLFLELQKIDKQEFNLKTPINSGSRNYGLDICQKATHMFSVRENGDVCMCVCSLRKVGHILNNENSYKELEKIFNVKNKWLKNFFVCDKCSKVINPQYLPDCKI